MQGSENERAPFPVFVAVHLSKEQLNVLTAKNPFEWAERREKNARAGNIRHCKLHCLPQYTCLYEIFTIISAKLKQ